MCAIDECLICLLLPFDILPSDIFVLRFVAFSRSYSSNLGG